MPSVSTLRSAASELRTQADRARELLDDVTRIAGEDLWSGPVAERFADELSFHRRQMQAVHDDLDATAAQLDAQADAIEARLEREQQERDRLTRERADSPPAPSPPPARPSYTRFVE